MFNVNFKHMKNVLLQLLILFSINAFSQGDRCKIVVKSEPGIKVYLDNKYSGVTTKEDRGFSINNIESGTYKLKFENSDSQVQDDVINLIPGQVLYYKVKPFNPDVEIIMDGGADDTSDDKSEVYFVVEDMPEFNGGDVRKFSEYISETLKYPEDAKKKNITGKVFVSFIVNKEGSVEKVKILRGVNPVLNKEAISVVKNSPKWKPGKHRGENVKVSFIVPINFRLN